MNIISRDIINKDILYNIYGARSKRRVLNYTELSNYIDLAKTYLIKEKQVKPGDRILFCPNELYIVWLFACAELGLLLVISISDDPTDYKTITDAYGKIDHIIMLKVGSAYKKLQNDYKEILIDAMVLQHYTDNDYKDTIWATPNTPLTWSLSETKLKQYDYTSYIHTHDFYYTLMNRNISILGLTETDKCTHSKILHHGSSLGLFFLPSIKQCKSHHWITTRNNWEETFTEEEITKSLFMYYDTVHFKYRMGGRSQDLSNLTIYVLRMPEKREIEYLVEKCHATVVSVFGTTVTSGPLFFQEITVDNYQTFDPTAFGRPLDDFYQFSIEDNQLIVTMFNGKTVNTGDIFREYDGQYFLLP